MLGHWYCHSYQIQSRQGLHLRKLRLRSPAHCGRAAACPQVLVWVDKCLTPTPTDTCILYVVLQSIATCERRSFVHTYVYMLQLVAKRCIYLHRRGAGHLLASSCSMYTHGLERQLQGGYCLTTPPLLKICVVFAFLPEEYVHCLDKLQRGASSRHYVQTQIPRTPPMPHAMSARAPQCAMAGRPDLQNNSCPNLPNHS